MEKLAEIKGVSKTYPRVHKPSDRLAAFVSLLLGRQPRHGTEVLHDINFEVFRGASVGIVGENGAGKSTLLKILTGVIEPTKGTVTSHGTIAAMLELGAGFQPDFSGLDNVRMKAALMGLSKAELDARLDDILEFADIGEYIHEPVKHYSSGMVVRLGFAVVTACKPDLLITDEVLAVGDESFQKKCIRWIEGYMKQGGTLLLVSHSMYVVQKLCKKAVWIHDGTIKKFGDVFPVTQAYLGWHERRQAVENEQRVNATGDAAYYRIENFSLKDDRNDDPKSVNKLQPDESTHEFKMGDDIEVELRIQSPDGRPPVGLIGVVRADGTPVYGVASDHEDIKPVKVSEYLYRYRYRLKSIELLPGSYNMRGHSMDPEGLRVFDSHEFTFTVNGNTKELGYVRLPHQWLD
jgi:lipopolysaccharide transport system ATP-binding protein